MLATTDSPGKSLPTTIKTIQDVSRLFPLAVQIHSVEELKGKLIRVAERLLLNR